MGELSSNPSPFWIQIHGLPLVNMTIKNVVTIGKGLGSLFKVDDIVWENKTFRSYLRVLVEIKVFDPLKLGFYLLRDKEEPLWISFRYDRLDFYCTICGKIGHKQSTCRAPLEECHPETYTISLKVNIFSNLPLVTSAWGQDASVSKPAQPPTGQNTTQTTGEKSPNLSLLTPTILKPLKDLSLLSNSSIIPLNISHHPFNSLNATQTHSPTADISAFVVIKDLTPMHH